MASFWNRLMGTGAALPDEKKSISQQSLFAMIGGAEANWSEQDIASLTNQGYARNPVVYRCVRMLAEASMRIPLVVRENGKTLNRHPVLDLLARPNPRQSGGDMLESVFSNLHTAGNAYLEAVIVEGEVKGLYTLRPDRMNVVSGKDGWPVAYDYTAGGKTVRLSQKTLPVPKVLHLKLFHPLDDHYGLAPLQAARFSLDTHNAAAKWNKALLDNGARPSGALVYSGGSGNLTKAQ
ncbi:MAG TPA: phage portal protein, partial [Devosia sp.]|nr:phage portal protein [Devosia sp.]